MKRTLLSLRDTVSYNNPLPPGTYRIGPPTEWHSLGWFNLYPVTDGATWDYHSKVPSFGCRGGFGLHQGTISEGCITISDNTCLHKLHAAIIGESSTTETVRMDECPWCGAGICWGGGQMRESVSREVYSTLLYVVPIYRRS